MLATLPDELLLHVFSRCSARTLGRVRRVSKPWRAIGDHDSLWRLFSCTRSVALCGEQLPPTLAMGSYRRARALFAHTCSQCAAAARAPVGFPSPKHSHLQDVRAQLVRQWTLTGAQLAAASSNLDQTGPHDEDLRYCALWMTRHGPRYWMRGVSNNDVVCANPNDVSTTDELLKWSACIADEARECLLGVCDVDGWKALPVALPDEAGTSCSHPLFTPAPHEWQRLERWLLSLIGTDARAVESHTGFPPDPRAVESHSGFPPDPRHVGTLRASVAFELEMRRSILALGRLLAAGDCILVFSVGLGPVDQIIGQGVQPRRQWQRVHSDGRSARPFRHSLGDEPSLPNRDDRTLNSTLPSGGAVIELVAVHLRTGRKCFLSHS